MIRVTLTRTVPHEGKMLPAGTEIEVDAETASAWRTRGWVVDELPHAGLRREEAAPGSPASRREQTLEPADRRPAKAK